MIDFVAAVNEDESTVLSETKHCNTYFVVCSNLRLRAGPKMRPVLDPTSASWSLASQTSHSLLIVTSLAMSRVPERRLR